MNKAYVTLLTTENFLKPVLILNRNLQKLKSQFPLLVMVTDTLKDSNVFTYLDKEHILYTIVPTIKYPEKTLDTMPDRLTTVASKLNVLNLDKVRKVVYLDADVLFFNNIDNLFSFPDGSLYDESKFYEDNSPNHMFCGLFTCIPQNHCFQHYLTILQHEYLWESDIIEELWFPFRSNKAYHIPPEYFVNFMIDNLSSFYSSLNEIKGVHFCSQYKPWLYENKYQFWADMFKTHPIDEEQNNEIRDKILSIYFTQYLNPLKQDYPELFLKEDNNDITNISSSI